MLLLKLNFSRRADLPTPTLSENYDLFGSTTATNLAGLKSEANRFLSLNFGKNPALEVSGEVPLLEDVGGHRQVLFLHLLSTTDHVLTDDELPSQFLCLRTPRPEGCLYLI